MDIAGIGEKPTTRSGPYFLIVKTLAAAIISLTSSQFARTNPPRPRTVWYSLRFASDWAIEAQASTGPMAARAARHSLSKRPRTSGYFTRLALYRYQL